MVIRGERLWKYGESWCIEKKKFYKMKKGYNMPAATRCVTLKLEAAASKQASKLPPDRPGKGAGKLTQRAECCDMWIVILIRQGAVI